MTKGYRRPALQSFKISRPVSSSIITSKWGRLILSVFLFLMLLITGNIFFSALGLALSLYIFLLFVDNLGHTVPVIEFMSLLAAIQLIVSPFFSYASDFDNARYSMAVPEQMYMGYTVSMFIVFMAFAFLTRKKIVLNTDHIKRYIASNPKLPKIIFAIGGFSVVLSPFIPNILAFFFYLSSLLLYIGGILFLYTHSKYKWWYVGATLLYPLIDSLAKGMFHEMILIYIFFAMYFLNTLNISKNKIILIIFLSMISLNTLQAIKSTYRETLKTGYSVNRIELFFNLWWNELFASKEIDDQTQNTRRRSDDGTENMAVNESVYVRYNQGWIVSRIYAFIPANSNPLGGKTIVDAVKASLMPRFLFPNKKTGVDSKLDFEMMTGITLSRRTSMGTSIFGEAYGNFEFYGGMIFMGLWGIFMGLITRWIHKVSLKSTFIILAVPILYLMSIRAESTVIATLNWFVKSAVFLAIISFALVKAGIIRRKTVKVQNARK
jgi:hypothetical protein